MNISDNPMLTKFKTQYRFFFALAFLLLAGGVLDAEILLKDITVTPRWPWNGLVDITYSVEFQGMESNCHPSEVWVTASGKDYVKNKPVAMKTLTGEGIDTPVTKVGSHTIVWDAGKDIDSSFNSADFTVTLQIRLVKWETSKTYLVVNLLDWSYDFRDSGPDLSGDTCRTTELWLRRIPKGTFLMGSPENELGRRYGEEPQHQVTLTQDYYIGLFECTRKQFELGMVGRLPPYYRPNESADTFPVEANNLDYALDFISVLRAKTGLFFDFPTEEQWEYACRAGTTTALNSGKNLTDEWECYNLAMVGRYHFNGGAEEGLARVGSYLPNAWGLYDMHGNCWEYCMEWTEAVPVPDYAGVYFDQCGGGFGNAAFDCRSSSRLSGSQGYGGTSGFRLVSLPNY